MEDNNKDDKNNKDKNNDNGIYTLGLDRELGFREKIKDIKSINLMMMMTKRMTTR